MDVYFNQKGGGNAGNPLPPIRFDQILMIVLVFVLLSFAGSVFYQVDQDEAGVVQRFGKYVRTTQPGLHMKLPFGIENVRKIKVTYVFKEEFGFRTVSAGSRSMYSGQEDNYRYRSNANNPLLQESLMLTGDLNVAVVEWIVQYTIKDPVKFAFNIRDPKETIRNMCEAMMRLVVGDRTINEVLTSGREEIQQQAEKKLQEILDSYESGIAIKNIILQEVIPPNEVKPSFNEVNEARQEREKVVNQAWAEYNRVIPRAKGEAEQQIRSAEGYAVERINQAKGDAERFLLAWEQYKKFPEVTKRRLYLEMAGKVYANVKDKLILDHAQKGILPLLQLEGREKQGGAS